MEKEKIKTTGQSEPFLTGVRLFLVMTGVTLVMFLAMLDIAIISTVRQPVSPTPHRLTFTGHPQDHKRLSQTRRRGMVHRRLPASQVRPLSPPLQNQRITRLSATVQPLTGKLFTFFNLKVIHTGLISQAGR